MENISPTTVVPEDFHSPMMHHEHAPQDSKAAEIAEKYIRKGTKLYVEGKLRTRVWEDRNTIKHNVTEIIVDQFDILSRPQQGTEQN